MVNKTRETESMKRIMKDSIIELVLSLESYKDSEIKGSIGRIDRRVKNQIKRKLKKFSQYIS